LGSMDFVVVLGSLVSLKSSSILISWFFCSHIKSRTNLWPDNPHDDQEIVLRVEENSHVLLFLPTSLCFNSYHVLIFPSHTLMGSIYFLPRGFLIGYVGNGVVTND
jgi:hypothetical protein